jgi:hypothetical protein
MLRRFPDALDFGGTDPPGNHKFVAQRIVEPKDEAISFSGAHCAGFLAEMPDENRFIVINLEDDCDDRSRPTPFQFSKPLIGRRKVLQERESPYQTVRVLT